MRLLIVAVGRLKDGPERELVSRYLERARLVGRALGWRGPDVIEIDEGRATRVEDRRSDEARRIQERLAAAADPLVIALDERGRTEASAAFATRLGRAREAGRSGIAFVIGGADGLDASLPRGETLAFGGMTLPHQMVRVILAEQIYRAGTILSGHPYHRG